MNEIEILKEIETLREVRFKKAEVIKTNNYEKAAKLRDGEKQILINLSKMLRCDADSFSVIEEKINEYYDYTTKINARKDKLSDLLSGNLDSDTNI